MAKERLIWLDALKGLADIDSSVWARYSVLLAGRSL